MSGIDFQEIRSRLEDQVETLARELVPDGRRNGAYWIGRNPTRNDRHAGSFWVRVRAPAIGAWRDEAGLRGVDEGDIIGLVRYVQRHADLKETRAWCLKWLGLSAADAARSKPDPAAIARREAERAKKRAAQDREEAERRANNARGAMALWLQAAKLQPDRYAGSVLDRYFLSRSIDLASGLLAAQKPLPGALRFFRQHDYRTADGELIGLPCLIALMSGPDGSARGVHRTWLARDGSGKAALPDPKHNKPRKIWPAGWQGSVIRIAKGAGAHSPEEAARRGVAGPLIITEGIEDALAVMLAMPDYHV